MSPEQVFGLANTIAVLSWMLLVAASSRHWTNVVTGKAISMLLAVAYITIVATTFGGAEGGASPRGRCDVAL
jgi:hypothetical protein